MSAVYAYPIKGAYAQWELLMEPHNLLEWSSACISEGIPGMARFMPGTSPCSFSICTRLLASRAGMEERRIARLRAQGFYWHRHSYRALHGMEQNLRIVGWHHWICRGQIVMTILDAQQRRKRWSEKAHLLHFCKIPGWLKRRCLWPVHLSQSKACRRDFADHGELRNSDVIACLQSQMKCLSNIHSQLRAVMGILPTK